jgi:hypothetical protein
MYPTGTSKMNNGNFNRVNETEEAEVDQSAWSLATGWTTGFNSWQRHGFFNSS